MAQHYNLSKYEVAQFKEAFALLDLNKDGQLEADVHYRDDKFDGYCEFFKPDGTLDDTILYSMDNVLETIKL